MMLIAIFRISSPLHLHSGEAEVSLVGANTTERSAFENTSPSRSPDQFAASNAISQSAALNALPLIQAIYPEEQKIENILAQIEEHKQPP